MSVGGREEFRQWPISARIGVSRALINANVPFEYVTGTDLRKGLAPRYKIIYLPFCISLPADLLKILTGYVDKGGRLVIDLPSAWYDENLALLPTGKGSAFENLFGVALHDFQYAGVNRPTRLEGLTLAGFTLDMESTHAKILARYDNGKPAVTEAALGQGKAVLLGCEASMLCFKPGNTLAESLLLKYSLGTLQPAFTCPEAIVYRLSSPQADHYFLINDAPARTARLTVAQYPYREAEDAWTGEKISLDSSIALEAFSGRWLRCAK
jgi:beta-galactosidase